MWSQEVTAGLPINYRKKQKNMFHAIMRIYMKSLVTSISLSKFNLPLTFKVPLRDPRRPGLTEPRPVREGIKLWITYILFWSHKDMESLPGIVISPMPGPPPRQHKHERQYTSSTHSVIPTRRIWNDDYDCQMIFGDRGGLKFPDICLTGEQKPRKTSPRKPVSTGDRTRARCVTSAHERWTLLTFLFGN